MKERLDKFLSSRKLTRSRTKAQELIRDKRVFVNGNPASRISVLVDDSDDIRLEQRGCDWVSRGVLKLEKALHFWQIDVQGKICLDVGACTGGFTQVFLSRDAKRVYALDVGREQLTEELRNDERVINLEGVNARKIPRDIIPELVDIISIDVSYISLELVLPEVSRLLRPGGLVVALIKPQFEVGKENIKRGVIREESKHLEVKEKIKKLSLDLGFEIRGLCESPITGSKGNKEFLICLSR